MDWKNIISITISLIALIFSIYQYFGEYRRAKNKDTLEEIYQLQNDVFDNLNYLRDNYPDLRECYPEKNSEPTIDKRERKQITNYLAKLDRFCAGVDVKVYSMKMVKSFKGEFFVRIYIYLRPVIVSKRIRRFNTQKEKQEERYHKFEKVARKLNNKYNYDLGDEELKRRLKNNNFSDELIEYVVGC